MSFCGFCGVGLTGIATRPDLSAYDYQGYAHSNFVGYLVWPMSLAINDRKMLP